MKTFTYLRRNPAVPAADFAERWREAALADHAAAPPAGRATRLAHCIVRQGRKGAPYDGVAMTWRPDGSDVPLLGPAVAEVIEPESANTITTTDRVVDGAAVLDDWWAAGRTAEGHAERLLLLVCIEAATPLNREQYRDYWWDDHRPFANEHIPRHFGPIAYVHNYVDPDDPSRWAGIAEMYERSLDMARDRGAWMELDDADPIRTDERRFLVRETRFTLVTDQHLVIGAGSPPVS